MSLSENLCAATITPVPGDGTAQLGGISNSTMFKDCANEPGFSIRSINRTVAHERGSQFPVVEWVKAAASAHRGLAMAAIGAQCPRK
jgi:hypothetical protein